VGAGGEEPARGRRARDAENHLARLGHAPEGVEAFRRGVHGVEIAFHPDEPERAVEVRGERFDARLAPLFGAAGDEVEPRQPPHLAARGERDGAVAVVGDDEPLSRLVEVCDGAPVARQQLGPGLAQRHEQPAIFEQRRVRDGSRAAVNRRKLKPHFFARPRTRCRHGRREGRHVRAQRAVAAEVHEASELLRRHRVRPLPGVAQHGAGRGARQRLRTPRALAPAQSLREHEARLALLVALVFE
jgi:hypothetical protein